MNRRTLPRTLLRGGVPAAAVAALALAGVWSASADTVADNGYDTGGAGWFETYGFDADNDGYVEEVALDTTGNARPDSWGTDTDVDGDIDVLTSDSDDDGFGDVADSVDPAAVPQVIGVVFTEAGTWEHWTPLFSYGLGYDYDAAAAAQDEADGRGDVDDARPVDARRHGDGLDRGLRPWCGRRQPAPDRMGGCRRFRRCPR